MPNYNYLIIGGGMTAAAAARGIREVDSAGSIGLISAEVQPPYDRPPLTKGLWKGQAFDQIWRELDDLEVTLHLGEIVQPLDVEQKRVLTQRPDEEHRHSDDTSGMVYTYDKLLLATGGTPRRLPGRLSVGNDHIIYYRTLAHYKRLRTLTEQSKQRFAVIGGGFHRLRDCRCPGYERAGCGYDLSRGRYRRPYVSPGLSRLLE